MTSPPDSSFSSLAPGRAPADPAGDAVALWWSKANKGTRKTIREADYYASSALPPGMVATLARAGVDIVDAHLVAPQGLRRGYYLSPATSEALRALDHVDLAAEQSGTPTRRGQDTHQGWGSAFR